MVNNRPSALAKWGLDYEAVHAAHPRLVYLYVTGYGAGGTKSDRPGFGTLAEAMSGFAHVTGQPDGPPTLPPFFLADGVAAQSATFAVMMALYDRDVHGGAGQLVDVNLIEPLARLIETSTLNYSQLGKIAGRVGNMLPASAPRNAFETSDGRWLAISSASPNIALRVFRAIDRPELVDDPEFADPVRRQARAREVDDLVAGWIRQRTLAEAMDVSTGRGCRRARLRRAAAVGRRAPACSWRLRGDGRRRPRAMTVQAPVARSERDPRRGRPPGPESGRGQRRRLRGPPRPRRGPPRRVARRGHHLKPGGGSIVRAPRARRSELATPASSERMCEKAPPSGADLVFLDLEDACAPAVKEQARSIAVGALRGLDWGRPCGRCGSTASTRPGATATSSRWSPGRGTASTC